MRTHSHELHSEIGQWTTPKTLWAKRICHLCESMSVEDENDFHLECPAYTYIRSQFQNLCFNSDLSNLLAPLNYCNLEVPLLKIFEHMNNILKLIK